MSIRAQDKEKSTQIILLSYYIYKKCTFTAVRQPVTL